VTEKLVVPTPPPDYRVRNGPIVPSWIEIIFIVLILMAFSFYVGMTEFSRVETRVVSSPCFCSCNNGILRDKNVQAPHMNFNWSKVLDALDTAGLDSWGYLVGNSMQPTLFERNIVLEMNFSSQFYLRPGVIVRYWANSSPDCLVNGSIDEYVIHRVEADYGDDRIVVSGDNVVDREVIKRCQIKNVIIGVLYS
jgi:hypothetical protein